MKGNNIQKVIYRYDILSDVLGIKVNRNFQYDETIEIEDGILLDFDVDDIPVSFEILDASKRFDLPKKSLDNIYCINVDVFVDEKSIAVNAAGGV